MPDVIFNGPDGRLEGRYHQSKQTDAPISIVLHPHPLHGGNMNNHLSVALHKNFSDLGFSTLRFNFRGVGKSDGEHDGGEGELAELAERWWTGEVPLERGKDG